MQNIEKRKHPRFAENTERKKSQSPQRKRNGKNWQAIAGCIIKANAEMHKKQKRHEEIKTETETLNHFKPPNAFFCKFLGMKDPYRQYSRPQREKREPMLSKRDASLAFDIAKIIVIGTFVIYILKCSH